nr:60S ribosomal protein L13a [Paratrimastix eleionoma]
MKEIVVDCKGHLKGRLASVIAKQLLLGRHVVAVRVEQLTVSGTLFRNRIKFMKYLNLKVNTNPRRGPYHYRAPAKIFWKSVRGMLPHKDAHGQAALDRLKIFEGCPPAYEHVKKMVAPSALKVLHMRADRKCTILGDLSSSVGWKHGAVVKKLEAKRIARGHVWHAAQTKKAL